MSHDPDFGPRPRGRAGAEIGSRRTLLIVLAVVLVAVVGLVVVLRSRSAPATCANGDSVACDFAARFSVTGYHQTSQTVSGHRGNVASYYVGPAKPDYLALISAPGLTLTPPGAPLGTAKEPVIGSGASTSPAFAPCAVLIYQIKPPQQRGFAGQADTDRVRSGEYTMLRIGLTCTG